MTNILNASDAAVPLPHPKKTGKQVLLFLFIALIFQFLLFPMPALADEAVAKAQAEEMISLPKIEINQVTDANNGVIIEKPQYKVVRVSTHTFTAYTSEAAQTDSSPCITANGFNVCEHGDEDTIAANFLKFGTKVRIPELFGDRIFVVRDRMNARYTSRIDIWMVDKNDAIKFGVKKAKIEVVEEI